MHDVNGATDYWRGSVLHSFLPSLKETIATHIIQEMGDQNVTSSGAINPSTNQHNFVQDWRIFPRFCSHSRAEEHLPLPAIFAADLHPTLSIA